MITDIKKLAKISETEVIELKDNNAELGIICKKPFKIGILGLKEK